MMERQAHIFDHSTNRRRLVRGLILICGLLLGLDWVLQRHTDHPWEALFGFYALHGFFACVALVLLARELRKLVMLATPLIGALACAGSAVGAVFAGDLLTLFVYWELLALTSAVLVFARRTDRALAAGIRYLAMMVVSGVLLLAGALLFERGTGGLAFGNIGLDAPRLVDLPCLRHQDPLLCLPRP
jgi:formate hydrogenlyase subunit 3/multisubunit Na+/H+ antiporter MnhD subunit